MLLVMHQHGCGRAVTGICRKIMPAVVSGWSHFM